MNRTTTKRLIPFAALALGLSLAGTMARAADGPGRGGRAARGIRAALASLDLSEDQKTKVKAIFEAERETGKAIREERRSANEALKAAAEAPTPDPAAVGRAFLKVDANRKAIKAEMEKIHQKVNALLTPAQQSKLEGYMAAVRHARRAMMGGPGAGGPPLDAPRAAKPGK